MIIAACGLTEVQYYTKFDAGTVILSVVQSLNVLIQNKQKYANNIFNFISSLNSRKKQQTNKKRKLDTNTVSSNNSVHVWLSQRLRHR